MPNPENIIGKGFESRPEAINKNGRPLKIYSILKAQGYSKDDITTAFKEVAFYDEAIIIELAKDKTKPMIIRIIANQFINAFKKDDYTKIKEILEHVIGKPVQPLQNDVNLHTGLNINVTNEQTKKDIENLNEII